jgi:hypothetical protein
MTFVLRVTVDGESTLYRAFGKRADAMRPLQIAKDALINERGIKAPNGETGFVTDYAVLQIAPGRHSGHNRTSEEG